MSEIERDKRGKALPPHGATLREIAAHYFFDVMAAEDESMGCRIDHDPIFGGPLFCCQWNGRNPLCAECSEIQARIEQYAVECITAALRDNAQPPPTNAVDPSAQRQER